MQILNDQEARFNSADMNIAYKMGVDEYQNLCPYASELEANWGPAPGETCSAPSALPCCALDFAPCPALATANHLLPVSFAVIDLCLIAPLALLLSFFGGNHFGNTIKQSLDERSDQISP